MQNCENEKREGKPEGSNSELLIPYSLQAIETYKLTEFHIRWLTKFHPIAHARAEKQPSPELLQFKKYIKTTFTRSIRWKHLKDHLANGSMFFPITNRLHPLVPDSTLDESNRKSEEFFFVKFVVVRADCGTLIYSAIYIEASKV